MTSRWIWFESCDQWVVAGVGPEASEIVVVASIPRGSPRTEAHRGIDDDALRFEIHAIE